MILMVDGKETDCLLDTGASLSVLRFSPGLLSPVSTTVTSRWERPDSTFLKPLSCSWGILLFSDTFLRGPESSTPFVGQDILSKLRTTVLVAPGQALLLPFVKTETDPSVWATRGRQAELQLLS